MRQWLTLFNKEMLEMWRNFKWIWFPISFILIGVMDPLTTYYMPQIIDSMGGLPEGAVIEIPVPSAPEVLFMSISQYNTLGILIVVLAAMGMISGERKSGVAELILVKPVNYYSYITAKWTSALVLLWISYLIGYLTSWYYVGILFEQVPFADFLSTYFLFGLWLSFALTITVFVNTMFKSPGIVGFVSMACVVILSLVTGLFSKWLEWSPSQLINYSSDLLQTGSFPEGATGAILITLIVALVLIGLAGIVLKKKELSS
jgi:ABC-2 type transport system permease protein